MQEDITDVDGWKVLRDGQIQLSRMHWESKRQNMLEISNSQPVSGYTAHNDDMFSICSDIDETTKS